MAAQKLALLLLVAWGSLVSISSSPALAHGGAPCREVRREFDRRWEMKEAAFERGRRDLRDERRRQIDHLHHDLRAATRLCPEERTVALRAIHAEIRETHRWFGDSIRELEAAKRYERDAWRAERDCALAACKAGHCPFCRGH